MFVSLELGLGVGWAAIAGPPSPNRQVNLVGVAGIGVARAITVTGTGTLGQPMGLLLALTYPS